MNARLHRSGHGLRTLLAGVLGIIVAAAFLVGVRTEITSLRYELQKLRSVESRLRREVEKLRIEAAVLTAPERLEARAVELGMTYPRSGQVISLPPRDPARGRPRATRLRSGLRPSLRAPHSRRLQLAVPTRQGAAR